MMKNELGVKPGDRIAVAVTNIPELGLAFLAAARIGAITVPFNYMLKAEELTRSISDCGAKVLLTEPGLFAINIRDKANIPEIEHWVMTGPSNQVPEGFLSIDTLTKGYEEAKVDRRRSTLTIPRRSSTPQGPLASPREPCSPAATFSRP